MNLLTCNDFEKIVIDKIPLIDVRAPIEFSKGAFQNTINLPLMNDEERHLVGICYKEKGNDEAVKLGYQLVSGKIKEERINAWISHLKQFPNSRIYCFRGGLRSRITQQWITEATGEKIERLDGGYKAFRNYLMTQLEPSKQKSKPILIGGYTGSGKTILLKKLQNAIDLEGIANHRGSAFGNFVTPQPTQINFENNLAYALIQHRHNQYTHMILEHEGSNVGKCFIPKPFREFSSSGDLVLVHTPFEQRVQITLDEYVYDAQKKYMETYSEEQGLMEWAKQIRKSLDKIKKSLGQERFTSISTLFEQALEDQINSGEFSLHKYWIETLLKDYYDPMYEYQMKKTTKNITFEGNAAEVLSFLESEEL